MTGSSWEWFVFAASPAAFGIPADGADGRTPADGCIALAGAAAVTGGRGKSKVGRICPDAGTGWQDTGPGALITGENGSPDTVSGIRAAREAGSGGAGS